MRIRINKRAKVEAKNLDSVAGFLLDRDGDLWFKNSESKEIILMEDDGFPVWNINSTFIESIGPFEPADVTISIYA